MLNAGAFGNIRQGKYIDWADRRIDASAPGYTARRGPVASILSSGERSCVYVGNHRWHALGIYGAFDVNGNI